MSTPVEAMSTPKTQEKTSEVAVTRTKAVRHGTKRGFKFWMVFVACTLVDGLSALDLTTVSVALPTIMQDLHGDNFIWAGSAYTIAATAVVPMIGGLVSVYGRKPVLLTFIFIFAIGCAIGGSSRNMNMLIAGRAIMGLGSGGCISVVQVVYADLIPLPERGRFYGITASVWALACGIGPLIGGALTGAGAWRWMFYLSIPLCAISFVLVLIFLHIHVPKDNFRNKMAKMDWAGLVIIIGSTISVLLALTWGGAQYAWSSAHVLVPLCIGSAGMIFFFVYEAIWATEPTVPTFMVTNRTTLSGYLGTFVHGIVAMSLIFYLPVYFQACKLASPIRSGIDMFGIAFTIAPFAMIAGATASIFRRYRPQNYFGWIVTVIGVGLLSTLTAGSHASAFVGFQVVAGMGLGLLWTATQFPILAPLPFSNNARALALFVFMRSFAQSWGTVIGGAVLQNVLQEKLPADFRATLAVRGSSQLAYAVIPQIKYLAEPLRAQVQMAFADATALIWRIMIGVSGLGLLTCLLMQEVEMRASLDEQWGMRDSDSDREGGLGTEAEGCIGSEQSMELSGRQI